MGRDISLPPQAGHLSTPIPCSQPHQTHEGARKHTPLTHSQDKRPVQRGEEGAPPPRLSQDSCRDTASTPLQSPWRPYNTFCPVPGSQLRIECSTPQAFLEAGFCTRRYDAPRMEKLARRYKKEASRGKRGRGSLSLPTAEGLDQQLTVKWRWGGLLPRSGGPRETEVSRRVRCDLRGGDLPSSSRGPG